MNTKKRRALSHERRRARGNRQQPTLELPAAPVNDPDAAQVSNTVARDGQGEGERNGSAASGFGLLKAGDDQKDHDQPANTFQRQVFTTSRDLEFFSEKELTLQTGYGPGDWPEVALQQLVDNALDAAEESGVAPQITVTAGLDSLSVADNGPGMSIDTIERILDFSSKTSSKDHYVSPTRGAQGNALKTILAIPYVMDGQRGEIEVESRGIRTVIRVEVNRLRQQPEIATDRFPSDVKNGTIVKIRWPELPSSHPDSEAKFLHCLRGFGLLNPHASIRFGGAGGPAMIEATALDWKKWCPNNPLPPQWFSPEQFTNLIAAFISGGSEMHISELVDQFRGLSGSGKQKIVLGELGLSGRQLSAMIRNDAVDGEMAGKLLAVMQRESREVKPQLLGIIGEEHIRANLLQRDCNAHSIRYRRLMGMTAERRPYVLEVAFGAFDDRDRELELVNGLNFSPCIGTAFSSADCLLGGQRVHQGCAVVIHLTTPHLAFSDRGKGSVILPDRIEDDLNAAILSVTKDWARIAKQQIRDGNAAQRSFDRMMRCENTTRTIKDIVWEHMPAAYNRACDNGKYPAPARQIMYQMRAMVLAEMPDVNFGDKYFLKTLLPEYLEEHRDEIASWDVVFDERGNFIEPHTDHKVPLGTVAVREYLGESGKMKVGLQDKADVMDLGFPTLGAGNRFANVLFVEKAGFYYILRAAHIAETFDLAIMDTKGLSTTAARSLMERMEGVRFFVLHDFDKAGFSIVGTLKRDTDRFKFKTPPEVIDLGLRLEDIEKIGLQSEPVELTKAPEKNLELNGATPEEIEFLTGGPGGQARRVELNAMTSPQFIELLEGKLRKYHVRKVVPDEGVLQTAYRRAWLAQQMNIETAQVFERLRKQAEVLKPRGLPGKIRRLLQRHPCKAWDSAIADLVSGGPRA